MSTVVLLHGLGNNEAIWEPTTAHWDPRVRVHAPRLPWHSGGIAAWRHESDSAGLLQDVLDAVPGGADVVVAHSFSSVLLLELLCRRAAAGNPLDVPAVVLVNPFYRADADEFHWDLLGTSMADFPRTMSESIRLRTLDRPIDEELRADMALRMTEWVGPYGWLRFFETYLRTPLLRVDLVHTPVLTIGGGLDLSAPVDEARRLAARLPAGNCVTAPDCGHFPMLERPEWFARTVESVLDGTPARSAPLRRSP
ncbi:alpha/beta fold hydrolase [Streptomyces sp. NPDC059985]|uniref:alpha/beta fold hydrolase n=1 Tax=Streptomyces sp. NPDC059985 TaxID=3347025 RepID=UPI00369C5859